MTAGLHAATAGEKDVARAWARHLAGPATLREPALSATEAQRVQHLRDQLMAALQARDRSALEQARQEVLEATYHQPMSAALRRALRELSWRMAALLLSRHGAHPMEIKAKDTASARPQSAGSYQRQSNCHEPESRPETPPPAFRP